MKRRGPKPRYIDTTWTQKLAYIVGIFASDGNLGKDGMYLNVTSKDKIVLKNVLKILKQEHIKIGRKRGGSGSLAYCVQMKSVCLHSWLVSIGLTPNKSKILGSIDIPDDYFFDFLRGVWDGDGSIYSFWDKRWRSSYMYYISFSSASIDFLNWLNDVIFKLTGVSGKISLSTSAGVLQLRFAKKDSKIIFGEMFKKENIPHLPRKFKKAQEIFKIDKKNMLRCGNW